MPLLPTRHRRLLARAVPIILLLTAFWSALSSAQVASPTYDEHEYISRGYLYLQTGNTDLKLRHPILLDLLAAFPLRLLPDIVLPLDEPALAAGDFHVYAARFMWDSNGEQLPQMLFLARLPALGLLLILLASVFSWARARFGLEAACLALCLAAFDPNLLAHGRLVTPDVGQTALIFLAAYAWWRYTRSPGRLPLLLAALTLGLAQTAGYPALVLYPLFFVAGVWGLWHSGWSTQAFYRGLLRPYLLLILGSGLTVWWVYGLSWGTVNAFGFELSLPAPYYVAEFIDLLARLSREDIAYLNGEVYRGGRWQFFIVGLLIKTPLPILLLAGLGGIRFLTQRSLSRDLLLWLIPVVYYGTALTSSLNIGYRHIIPILPFLSVWGGSAITLRPALQRWPRVALGGLVGWLILLSWQIYPFYLTYFNELVGGPRNGLNYLVISDLDWGQDLPQLQAYLAQREPDQLYLSYFGTTPPQLYGIDGYRQLRAWPPRGIPGEYPFHPAHPLPGTYALSAANLVGSHFEDNPDLYAWFRTREPSAVLGNSIYIYDVGVDPTLDSGPVGWAAHALPLSGLPASFVTDTLGSNNIQPRWFDATQALVIPTGRSVLQLNVALPGDPALIGLLESVTPNGRSEFFEGVGQTMVYKLEDGAAAAQQLRTSLPLQPPHTPPAGPSCAPTAQLTAPATLGGAATLLGWHSLTPLSAGTTFAGVSVWRIERPLPATLSIFVHLLAPDGSISAQSDRLDARTDLLQPGDLLIQRHDLDIPEALSGDSCWLALGLYDRATLQRLSLPDGLGDRIFVPLSSD